MKDEREILTRQIISEKLCHEAKRSLICTLMICILGAILFLTINLGINTFTQVKQISKIILFFLQLFFYAICAYHFIRAIIDIFNIKRGTFTVTEDKLIDSEYNEPSLLQFLLYSRGVISAGKQSYMRHVFRFESGKKFVANAEEYKHTKLSAAAQFSTSGDIFYVVFYNNSPNKIILLFSAKTHSYPNKFSKKQNQTMQ